MEKIPIFQKNHNLAGIFIGDEVFFISRPLMNDVGVKPLSGKLVLILSDNVLQLFGGDMILLLCINNPEKIKNIWVYDDEFVKGLIHIEGKELTELYVDCFSRMKGLERS